MQLPNGPVLILDTETGGFNPARNPLLSIGLLVGDLGKVHSTISVKFVPPEGTWLEVPIREDQLKGKYSKTIEFWLNLTTGEHMPPQEEKPVRFINAIAAEVNGFVGASETVVGWDTTKIALWGQHTYETGLLVLIEWLAKQPKLNAVICHNADFDLGFVEAWLPGLMKVVPPNWHCTQDAYKHKFLGGKTKGSSLGAICKIAGFVPEEGHTYHTELGDCAATHFIWGWLRGQGI